MSSLAEYIEWYSDFTFYEKPFNDVDNFVLSMLAYYDFDLKRDGGRPMMLRRCVKNSITKDSFLRAAYNSKRFGNLMVSHYSEYFSHDTMTQFAAMTFHLHDNVYYIAFRGTDMSLVGWREDFIISYQLTEGQKKAVAYLDEVIEEDKQYIVGGHSKGGHLALYGCCHISDEKLARVIHIYNNDGPGLCPEVLRIPCMRDYRKKAVRILPVHTPFDTCRSNQQHTSAPMILPAPTS